MDPSYRGWMLCNDEADRVAPRYVGKPVCVEHDVTRPMGTVTGMYKDKTSKSLVVDVSLNNDVSGLVALTRVLSGELRELSISFDATRVAVRTNEAWPTQISLVSKGAMKDAMIFTIWVDDSVMVCNDTKRSAYEPLPESQLVSIRNSLAKMSSAPAPASPAAPVADAAATDPAHQELLRLAKLGRESENEMYRALQEALAKNLSPAWAKVTANDPHAADADMLGAATVSFMNTQEGRLVLAASSRISGNFLQLEAKYEETVAKLKQLEDDRAKELASRNVLGSADERSVPMNVANSAGAASASTTASNKRHRLTDIPDVANYMESFKNAASLGESIRRELFEMAKNPAPSTV